MYLGLTAGLIDGEHHKRLGAAWMLFAWCVLRQTGQGKEGIVCRGAVLTYQGIASEMNCQKGSVREWMRRLVNQGYIRTERDRRGIRIFVRNPKKIRLSQSQRSQTVVSVGTSTGRVLEPQHSKGIHPIDSKGASENLLQNNLTKLLKNNNTARTLKNARSFPSFPKQDNEQRRQEVLHQADHIREAYKRQPPCLGKTEADAFIQSCIDKTKGPVAVQ